MSSGVSPKKKLVVRLHCELYEALKSEASAQGQTCGHYLNRKFQAALASMENPQEFRLRDEDYAFLLSRSNRKKQASPQITLYLSEPDIARFEELLRAVNCQAVKKTDLLSKSALAAALLSRPLKERQL